MSKKVIFTSPLKSLSNEKLEAWTIRFPDKRILMLTGDTLYNEVERKKQMLLAVESDVIITTSELLDSVTRKYKSEKNYWLNAVGLLIVDESHVLTTNRGSAVEVGIMRFSKLNPNARICFLSATMPNVGELGAWLTKLNNKETKVLNSTWRPVELDMHYIEYEGSRYYQETQDLKKSLAIDIIQSKPNEKFLVFCHDKATGRSIVSLLKRQGIDSKFHNADLGVEERHNTEKSFEDREKGLRVLVSTSTLAWGRNTPAKNVIVVGVHRGIQEVDELDIIQMSGRAGRTGYDTTGTVYLIIPEGTTEMWKETFKHPRPVISVLKNESILAFHVLAEIANGEVRDAKSLLVWYERSLASFQSLQFSLIDAEALLDRLEAMEMLTFNGEKVTLTGLGRVCALLYYSPFDVYKWYKNFDHIIKNGKMEDLCIAWALTDIPSNDMGYIPKDAQNDTAEFQSLLRNRGIQSSNAAYVSLGALLSMRGEDTAIGSIKAVQRSLKFDIMRIKSALSLIDSFYARWNTPNFWESLSTRIVYGVPTEMLELVKLPGIGAIRAKKLWEAGIHTITDVTTETSKLLDIFDSKFTRKLQSDAEALLRENK